MKVIKPIVTVTVYLKESDLFVSMISMELPRTHNLQYLQGFLGKAYLINRSDLLRVPDYYLVYQY